MPFKSATNPKVKLTPEQVSIIKDKIKEGIPGKTLAEQFNVHPSTITRIKRNKTWR